MNLNEQIKNLSIVLVGQFNPSIITPHWLSTKKSIRESEADNAEIKIIHPEISEFKLSFAEIHVTQDKFIINCNNEADFDLAKDLVISIFNFLNETPVSGIGLNHIIHFSFPNAKLYNNFGNWLAPHHIWNEHVVNPKLLELKITEPFSESNPVKNLTTISTSEKFKQFGVRYQLNYHIEVSRCKNKSIASIIIDNWEVSMDKSNKIFNSIINKFDGK